MKKNFVYFLKIFWGKAKQMSTVMLSGYMCTCGSLVYKWISIGADVGGTHCNGDWETIRVTSIYIQNLTHRNNDIIDSTWPFKSVTCQSFSLI